MMTDDFHSISTAEDEIADEEIDQPEITVLAGAANPSASQPKIPDKLPVLPIRNSVAFPGTVMPLQVNRSVSRRVLDIALAGDRMIAVVTQRTTNLDTPRSEDLYLIGTACQILKMYKMPDGGETIIAHGIRRVGIESYEQADGYLLARVNPQEEPLETTTEQRALMHIIRSAAARMIELSPNIPQEALQVLNGIDNPSTLADFLAANLSLSAIFKQELLETLDVTERLRKVNVATAAQLEVLELSNKIQQQVHKQVDQSQREYYLREQMKAIRQELGEQSAESKRTTDLQERIKAAKMPAEIEEEAIREVTRLEQIPSASPEYSMTLDYVEWLVELPWSISTEDTLDIVHAQKVLNEDHYGLEKVKKRIIEFLAVHSLKKDTRGPILCFAGPPGVGKTSLGRSIARAMGRKFIRLSLGGVHDEAAIRGHRRTYIGSMPGQIIRELRRAGSNNPLFMLDEVDKVGEDARGDPMSALLEVLDPAQNSSFMDHYLGVPFNLSGVLFIGTANYIGAIEPALRDRMEIIEIPGYTHREKIMIARQFLLPRQLEENGLKPDQLIAGEDILTTLIADYTREAGVRSLERRLGAICRSRATALVRKEPLPPQITSAEIRSVLGPAIYEQEMAAVAVVPGVVTGLAVTSTGGEIMFIEATKMPGRGQLNLTGQLGDVMRESAITAGAIIRSRASNWGISPQVMRSHDLHVHLPSGAIPKDGPSAGVAMLTAMMGVLTDRTVDPKLGMTGEVTLSGRVLSVGGIRDKVLAAHRAGLHTVLLPATNEPNVEDVPSEVREQLDLVYVKTIDEVLDHALQKRAVTKKKKSRKRKAAPRPARKNSASTSRNSIRAATKPASKKKVGKRAAAAARPRSI